MPTLGLVRQAQVGLYASPMRNTRQPEIDTCGCARPAIPIDRFRPGLGRRLSTNNKNWAGPRADPIYVAGGSSHHPAGVSRFSAYSEDDDVGYRARGASNGSRARVEA